MLGYLAGGGRGAADEIVAEVAARLRAEGMALAGAVQVNVHRDPARKCDMELHVLSGTEVVRISQDLGLHSSGCRLDSAGLERAAGLVAAALAEGPALLVVNKFGKQEAEGRGFRPLIGQAVAEGIPVLTAVNASNLPAFLDFAGDLAEALPSDPAAVAAWCRAQAALA